MIRQDVEERPGGAAALDRTDAPIGEVCGMWVDERTARPMWASVRVPELEDEVLVPLEGAEWDEASVRLAVDAPTVATAPRTSTQDPTDEDQERLYTHYGIPTVRTPRSLDALLALGDMDVCYALHEG